MDLNIAIIGAGYASHLRCAAIKKINSSSLNLKGVFDKNIVHSKEFAEEFKIKLFKNLDEILADDDINALLICTPNRYHYSIAKNGIERNKNIISEYPLTVNNYGEAEELINHAIKKDLFIHVGQTMNFDADAVFARAKINLLGKILMGYKYMSFGSLGSWFDLKNYKGIGSWYVDENESGSWFVSAHYHGVQIFRNLFGEVNSVYAVDSSIKGVRAGSIILKHENGSSSTIQWGMPLNGRAFNTMIISGTQGSIEFDNNNYLLQSSEFSDRGILAEKDTFFDDCQDLLFKLKLKKEFEKSYADMLGSLKVSFGAEEAARNNKVIKF